MIKQELEKAIENGESVWVALDDKVERLVNLKWFTDDVVKSYNIDRGMFQIITKDYFNHLYKTKAGAEHYLHHANITRTETLPFLTWEEFKGGKELYFTNKSGYPMCLRIVDTKLGKKIGLGGANEYFDLQQIYDLTEENFYKAYDECVRLFKEQ